MGKGAKVIGTLFLLLGIASIACYFVLGDEFSNYKVIFDSNGGTSVTEQVVKKGEKAVKPADPTKENNEFLGWQLDGVAYNFDLVVTKNMTLKANWKEIINHEVAVTLEENEYKTIVRDGDKATLAALDIPEKEGFEIKIYSEDETEYDFNTPVTKDLKLTAKYVEIVTYTVKFNSNGGTKVDDIKAVSGTTITAPVSTKDGYIFDGWYLGEEKFDFTTPITKSITLKARWNDGPKINVIFMVDDKVYKTIATKENTAVSKPSNPTKTGYKFVEWQLNGEKFDFNTKITSEITLKATFEEVTSYTVTFDKDNGSNKETKTVNAGDKVTKPSDPTKSGYKFVEWQLNGSKYDFSKAVNSDITLKAKWEQEKTKYTVRFNNDDDTEITTQTVEEGAKAKKPADPVKEGYRFIEWLYNHQAYNFDNPVTANIVLTARYEKINSDIETTE